MLEIILLIFEATLVLLVLTLVLSDLAKQRQALKGILLVSAGVSLASIAVSVRDLIFFDNVYLSHDKYEET